MIHELATNAAKYGALSRNEGCVSVNWTRQGESLIVQWKERGGPPIEGEPEKQGFGSALARNAITGQLGGTFAFHWAEQGLIVEFKLPLTQLTK